MCITLIQNIYPRSVSIDSGSLEAVKDLKRLEIIVQIILLEVSGLNTYGPYDSGKEIKHMKTQVKG